MDPVDNLSCPRSGMPPAGQDRPQDSFESRKLAPAIFCGPLQGIGGQASAPRVPTATAPAMGSAAFGAGAGKSEEPLDLGTMPVTLIADLAGLSARR